MPALGPLVLALAAAQCQFRVESRKGHPILKARAPGCPHGADNKVPVLAFYSDTASLFTVSIAVIVVTARIPATLRVVRWDVRVMGGIMGSLLG
ncbi:hypothetical protein AWV79_36400 [Cupriavidus sp. UYMMa02A]|nr:hypothetical protein AWV79_36400 [Cupriavidus sp. UYMMa02A]